MYGRKAVQAEKDEGYRAALASSKEKWTEGRGAGVVGATYRGAENKVEEQTSVLHGWAETGSVS